MSAFGQNQALKVPKSQAKPQIGFNSNKQSASPT
jgi:hypothetical protein